MIESKTRLTWEKRAKREVDAGSCGQRLAWRAGHVGEPPSTKSSPSASRSAKIIPQLGPIAIWENAMTRIPANGSTASSTVDDLP
ncbi:hypothetical protein [Brevibacterium marinum]|uniref:Uncharacterized protein n=1 Tax=Brevibacterium marinum TaxID=418643 RepID=A0A846RV93_9MICO|nr:hypothetical protein [Brevibacterium marinum]NJC55385.1 hypothetical protein [Brevibacterium marinum]